MIDLLLLYFLIALAAMAFWDFKTRTVPRFSILLLMGLAIMEVFANQSMIPASCVSFGVMFLIGWFLNKRMFFGKADWLVGSAVAMAFGSKGLFVAGLSFLFAFAFSSWKRDSTLPVLPFYAGVSIIVALSMLM